MKPKFGQVVTLDVKESHVNNPECPSRIAPHPTSSYWYCVDCGHPILCRRMEYVTECFDGDGSIDIDVRYLNGPTF